MKSWKTTIAGVSSILIAVGGILGALSNGASPDWTAAIAAIVSGIGLIAARDNGVTSEAAGAK